MGFFPGFKIFIIILLCSVSLAAGQEAALPFVVLEGEDGGTASGEGWNSRNLTGKTNLILYVDTEKKKSATPLIEKIDSLRYPPDTLETTFIVNTKATIIPDFLIRTMIKRRQKANENIRYVLDRNEVLIKKWNFTDDYLNVLVLDPYGKILHRHAGEISDEYIDKLVRILDHSLNSPQDREE